MADDLVLGSLRYDDTMGGVVVSYSDVEILERCGRVLFDNPFIHFYVATKFTVFSLSIGGHLGNPHTTA